MTEGWAYGGGPPLPEPVGTVTLVEGAAFTISGRSGDMQSGAGQGLFFRDTRFVDRFELTVDGQRLEPLSVHLLEPFAAEFLGRRPPRQGTADSTLLVVRRRYVGNGMFEQISLRNLGQEPAGVVLQLHVGADFAGLFQVKEGRATPPEYVSREATSTRLQLGYRSGEDSRGLVVTGPDAVASADRLTWQLMVTPRQQVTVTVDVIPVINGVETVPRYRANEPVETSHPVTQLAKWRQTVPKVTSADQRLTRLIARSAEDLGVLRIFDERHPDRAVIAAGAPWFMTLFGRDSLLTSWMLLPLDASLALGTLQTLADLQGTTIEPFCEEEPGRIMHEVRSGMDTHSLLGGANVYYGSADATPLFVMLLGELRRWGLAHPEVEALLPHADRALEWITQYGDRDGDGFVEYLRATDRGLVNQGWKDSFDAISFASGVLAEPPIALAEVQGYVYAAYLARAHFAHESGDDGVAEHWEAKARALKARFNEAFWLPDRGYYAMALDRDKRPVDALASNMGHCLWTGIVDEEKAPLVAQRLLEPDLFTGFGVRTLAASMNRYNPMSYHNGSVWPHDNAIIAAGLARYGCLDEAETILLGLLDAAEHFGNRLPELFCGFDRIDFASPVPYPTSCSPQAWAAAGPLLLLRSLLRFDPAVPSGRVWCDPAVPDQLLPLRIEGFRLAGSVVTVEVTETEWAVTGLPADVQLIRSAR